MIIESNKMSDYLKLPKIKKIMCKALATILWTKTFWVNNNFFAAYFHCKNIYRKGIIPHGYIKCDFGADFSQK